MRGESSPSSLAADETVMPNPDGLPRRVLFRCAVPDVFAPTTVLRLVRLGYAILDREAFAQQAALDDRPDAFMGDVRLLGAVPRPAGMHEH